MTADWVTDRLAVLLDEHVPTPETPARAPSQPDWYAAHRYVRPGCTCGADGLPPGPHESFCGKPEETR